MNKVLASHTFDEEKTYRVWEITREHYEPNHTAFIGKVGNNSYPAYDNKLFLVTYVGVVLAENPAQSWDGECTFIVSKWVDIVITIINN